MRSENSMGSKDLPEVPAPPAQAPEGEELLKIAEEALEWYADGLYPGDESYVGNELRNGRRAREALSRLREGRGN